MAKIGLKWAKLSQKSWPQIGRKGLQVATGGLRVMDLNDLEVPGEAQGETYRLR
jgi:hypothetical protein